MRPANIRLFSLHHRPINYLLQSDKMSGPIAYIMSRFPKITETFILNEMVALEESGLQIEVFSLVREKAAVQHRDADRFVAKAHFPIWGSAALLAAQLYWLRRRPGQLFNMWITMLWGNRTSLKFLLRTAAAVLAGADFAREIERCRVRHIHAHWATHATTAALVVHQLTGISFSFTGHAHDIYVNQSMLAQKVAAAAFMVTISDYNKRLVTSAIGPELGEKIQVIRCGVDTALFQPQPSKTDDRPLNILCIGRLEKKKGQMYLVEACRLLQQRGVKLICRLLGGGDDREALTSQIEMAGLSGVVELLDHQPRRVVLQMLAWADVVVMPSITLPNGKKEGIPVALMEALATGLPAVASNLSGIPELIVDGETGLLVPEKDPLALADALLRLKRDPLLRQTLGQQGRAKVISEYDLTRNTARLKVCFEQFGHSDVSADPQQTAAASISGSPGQL